ncbi:hypothetical protein DI09_32p10 [Mitosporidium daphniae]|uniref:Succinate dehydrogenase cytochrome b560 subunit, mitochondrial n=1 Tax=Mitosporidium daphniae TaxID=1485682 RepID=A0A098VUY4_9MICR|nr:uncharacterized protein DI09_32p10 [Mitosporidium daphniae]KGG51516.1 hypothetical protein DI09_32p10 [Mitosporidium daphniae]|eukprot:XP_013237968.1 uncharacterized protein DI09_32p10 [Mitosporidium daphniae]
MVIAGQFPKGQVLLSLLKGNIIRNNVKIPFSIKRPLSPHITIYSFPLTSVLSIGHRATGVALGSLVYALGVFSAVSVVDVSKTANWIRINVPSSAIVASKFILALPYTFHFSNGIRHLVWDMGYCLSLSSVYTTGYAVLASTLFGSGILASL